MEKSVVDFERRDEIGLITLNNPAEAQRAVARGARAIDRSGSNEAEAAAEINCVILRAAGPVFSAGHDLREIIDATDAERSRSSRCARKPCRPFAGCRCR